MRGRLVQKDRVGPDGRTRPIALPTPVIVAKAVCTNQRDGGLVEIISIRKTSASDNNDNLFEMIFAAGGGGGGGEKAYGRGRVTWREKVNRSESAARQNDMIDLGSLAATNGIYLPPLPGHAPVPDFYVT